MKIKWLVDFLIVSNQYVWMEIVALHGGGFVMKCIE